MPDKTTLQRRKQELLVYLEQAARYKTETIKFVGELRTKLYEDRISSAEFNYKLNLALKGRKAEEWINYYDSLIKSYNKEISNITEKLKENQNTAFGANSVLVILFFFMIAITGIILIKPQITGFVVYQPGEIINDTLTLTIPENLTINESIVKVNLNAQQNELPLSNFDIELNLVTINLERFNLLAEEGTLTAQIIFNNSIISEASLLIELQQITQPIIEENITNLTIPEIPQISTTEKFDNVTIPKVPRFIEQQKIYTIEEIINEGNINIPKEKIKNINKISYASEEVTLNDNKKTLIIHKPIINSKEFNEAVPLIEKDDFTYSASFEDTAIEIEFDSPEIKQDKTNKKFKKNKASNTDSWKISYNYLLPSQDFKARFRISSSSPIQVVEDYYGIIKAGKFNLDFTTERDNNFDIEINQVNSNIVYLYLNKNYSEYGKFVNDEIILDPTLTVDGTSYEVCYEFPNYTQIEVINNGVLTVCARTTAVGSGYANITLGNDGNFSLSGNSRIEGGGMGATGGASCTGNSCSAVAGENGENWTVGAGGTGNNGGGGGGFGGTGGTGGEEAADGVQPTGGQPYGSATGEVLFGGSGSGGSAGDAGAAAGVQGGAGLRINASAGWITIYGIINMSGANGTDGDGSDNSGSGGGSGGHVILEARNLSLGNGAKIFADGAKGGGGGSGSCGGGGGGGGRILYIYTTAIISSTFQNFTLGGNIGVGSNTNCDAGSGAPEPTVGTDGTIAHVSRTFPDPPEPNSPPNNVSSLVINSTTVTQTNYTNETIQVRFNVSDINTGDTLNYSIQWIRNNKTNFTLVNLALSNPGATVENLQPDNTTRGDTWMVQVLVCDNNNACNAFANTTELLIISTPPNNRTPVIINSTLNLQLNLTTENLQVRVDVNDTDTIDLLTYNITWLTEDRINFTLPNISINNPGTIVETLPHTNTTKGQNWSAQIVICDQSYVCSRFVNSTKLLILNSNATITQPAFNQTSYNTEQIINVSLVFSDDDQDANSVTFEWFKNDALIKRATNGNLANGTNSSDILTPDNFVVNDNIIVQAFAYDGERNSTLLNSTTLTIQSANTAPNNPTALILNSSNTAHTNLTNEDLLMIFQCDDPDASDTLTFHLTAFKDFENKFQLQGSCNDPENKTVILSHVNTTKNDTWSFSVNVSDDSSAYSATISTVVNLSILNTAPIIGNVTLDEADNINLVENGNKTFRFSFVVTDADNLTDIVNISAVANITRGFENTAEAIRYNDTFVNSGDGGCNAVNLILPNSKNFSCTINVVFYDGAGAWNISVRINDSVKRTDIVDYAFAQNNTQTFTINELTALVIYPSTISFPTIALGDVNVSARINITINNTGNDDISGRELSGETINITAITLIGETDSTTVIPTNNFSIGTTEGMGVAPAYCDPSVSNFKNVTKLINTTAALSPYNNFSGPINGSYVLAQAIGAQEILQICLLDVPDDLTAGQNYSSSKSGTWSISIFFFRRRKDKSYEKNKEAINSVIRIKIGNKLNDREFMRLINYEESILIPISIFKDNSPLEALVKYLKENLNLSLSEIASLLNRDQRTIWITYDNASRKINGLEGLSKKLIPINVFSNRKLSILENTVYYLVNKGISLNNIAKILNRNYKTIWTTYSRTKNKHLEEKKQGL